MRGGGGTGSGDELRGYYPIWVNHFYVAPWGRHEQQVHLGRPRILYS